MSAQPHTSGDTFGVDAECVYLLRTESRYSGENKGVVGSRQESGPGPVRRETLDASSGLVAGIRPAQDRSDGQREEARQAVRCLHI